MKLTSNIDIESEEIILNIIHSLAKEKTVIYISHRLPAIKNADCIYVMDKGRVIESGNIMIYIQKKNFITICTNIRKNWKAI